MIVFSNLLVKCGTLTALLLIASVTQHPHQRAVPEWWGGAESDPLVLSPLANGYMYALQNRTDRKVSGYRLGCVIARKGKPKYVKRERIEVRVSPGEWAMQSEETLRDPRLYCEKRGGKLALIEVTFESGPAWYAGKTAATPTAPPRPGGVPKEAAWAGGRDGGCFILCTYDAASKLNRCTVYNDRTARIEAQGLFQISGPSRAVDALKFRYSGSDFRRIYLADGSILAPASEPK